MAVIQSYFDPTVGYVPGSFFIGYLQAFIGYRSQLNDQLMKYALERESPEFRLEQLKLIQKNIDNLKDEKVDPTEVRNEKAKVAARYQSRVMGLYGAGMKKQDATSRKADTKRDTSLTKLGEDMGGVLGKEAMLKIAKSIDASLEGTDHSAKFDKVGTIEGFRLALDGVPGDKKNLIQTAIATEFGGAVSGGVTKVKGFEDVGVDALTNVFMKRYKIGGESFASSEEEKKAYEVLFQNDMKKIEETWKKAGGTFDPSTIDISEEGAMRTAQKYFGPVEAMVDASNLEIDQAIAKYEKEKTKLMTGYQSSLTAGPDISGAMGYSPYSSALSMPFTTPRGVPKLRGEAPKEDVEVDQDIVGMMGPQRTTTQDDSDIIDAPWMEKPGEFVRDLAGKARGLGERGRDVTFEKLGGGKLIELGRRGAGQEGQPTTEKSEAKGKGATAEEIRKQMQQQLIEEIKGAEYLEDKTRERYLKRIKGRKVTTEELEQVGNDIKGDKFRHEKEQKKASFSGVNADKIKDLEVRINALTGTEAEIQKTQLGTELQKALEGEDLSALESLSQSISTYETPTEPEPETKTETDVGKKYDTSDGGAYGYEVLEVDDAGQPIKIQWWSKESPNNRPIHERSSTNAVSIKAFENFDKKYKASKPTETPTQLRPAPEEVAPSTETVKLKWGTATITNNKDGEPISINVVGNDKKRKEYPYTPDDKTKWDAILKDIKEAKEGTKAPKRSSISIPTSPGTEYDPVAVKEMLDTIDPEKTYSEAELKKIRAFTEEQLDRTGIDNPNNVEDKNLGRLYGFINKADEMYYEEEEEVKLSSKHPNYEGAVPEFFIYPRTFKYQPAFTINKSDQLIYYKPARKSGAGKKYFLRSEHPFTVDDKKAESAPSGWVVKGLHSSQTIYVGASKENQKIESKSVN